jgi:hypothetical protein
MAEGGEVCSIGGMDSEEEEIEEGHGDPFKSSFLKECGPWAIVVLIFTFKKTRKKTRKKILPIFNHHQLKTKIFQVQRIGNMCWNGSIRN